MNPDPAYKYDADPDADPDPAYHIDAEADNDPTFWYDAGPDPNPQHCCMTMIFFIPGQFWETFIKRAQTFQKVPNPNLPEFPIDSSVFKLTLLRRNVTVGTGLYTRIGSGS